MAAQRFRSLIPGAVLALLLASAPAPLHAAPPSAPTQQLTAAATLPPDTVETDRSSRPVAPGVTLTSFDRIDGAGWLRADALTADLTGGVEVDYLYSGAVSTPAPLSESANRSRAVAAVNGDFFDINNSSAAQGIGIQDGQLVQSPVAGHNNAVAITADGAGRVLQVFFEGTATPDGGAPIALTQFNNLIAANGVGVFTSLWGDYPRSRAVAGAAEVRQVTLVDGIVTDVETEAGEGAIPTGTTVLLGRDAGAQALASAQVGDRVEVTYRPRSSDGSQLRAAIGGNHILVYDGAPKTIADTSLAPRTAVGFSADGRKMFLLTVDGRQADSRGATLTEMGTLMAELGAHYALNLDGGGSSTMLAREPGAGTVQVENQPSDGGERSVPNGLALFAPGGSGQLHGFWVETAMDPLRAPGLSPISGGRPDRVFAGLTRRLTAAGFDEAYGPAAGTPRWRTEPAQHGLVNSDGVFRAALPGTTKATAFTGSATGHIELSVLGPLRRIAPTTARVALNAPGSSGSFGIVGYDEHGRTAPIEPADARLDYDRDLFDITASTDGTFKVRGKTASAAGLVTVRVGKSKTVVAVTVGLVDQLVADFDDAASWTFTHARAAGSVSPTTGHDGTGLKMSYDFSRDTATRAAYANPAQLRPIPGQPLSFTMWLNSAGQGEWPSLHLLDGDGQALVLRGPFLTWTGWRQIEFEVPPGTVYPLTLRRFYVAETRAAAQYSAEIVIDELVAKVPPSIDVPATPVVVDPLVVADGTVADAPWRFAVISDAQFVGRDPDSEIVLSARRMLREIRAAAPEFLIINGDWVDEARPEDFELAKRILDEELAGELPYYYVPGNHEVMGGAIDNFKSAFGETYRVFDHNGTRFVTLDTSRLTIRGGGFDQIAALRSALDQAAVDDSVGSVVVLQHVPLRDPTPAKASQLNDRKEAALLEQWLAEFSELTGKGALFVGAHVGLFHAERVDGVPYFINGNSGKAPAGAATDGGFLGWTMFGVDPITAEEAAQARRDAQAPAPQWISAETIARADSVQLQGDHPTVRVGSSVVLSATVTQGTRPVPVAFPVSADWSAGPEVHIGPASGLRPWHVAWFDPATGKLTGLRAGSATVHVTVNGVKGSVTVPVTG